MAEPKRRFPGSDARVDALLNGGLERVREIREMLLAADLANLEPCCLKLDHAADQLRLALEALREGNPTPAEADGSLVLAGKLKRQTGHLASLLDGWASFLTGWQIVRQCYEYGYTANGTPAAASAASVPRGEL